MLDSQKNKLTVEILKKLKKKGVPPVAEKEPIQLMGETEAIDEEIDPLGQSVRLPLSLKNLTSQKRKAKKPISEDEVI